jgi:hypothetical protein
VGEATVTEATELPTVEHDDRVVGEVEPRHEQVAHALGVVDAPLELVPRVPVGDPAHHGALPPVHQRRGRAPPRLEGPGAAARVGLPRRGRDVGDGAADGAADAGRPVRELQRRAAARAIDQHHRHPRRGSRRVPRFDARQDGSGLSSARKGGRRCGGLVWRWWIRFARGQTCLDLRCCRDGKKTEKRAVEPAARGRCDCAFGFSIASFRRIDTLGFGECVEVGSGR